MKGETLGIIFVLGMMVLSMPVSAGQVYPISDSLSAGAAYYTTNYPNKTYDDNVATYGQLTGYGWIRYQFATPVKLGYVNVYQSYPSSSHYNITYCFTADGNTTTVSCGKSVNTYWSGGSPTRINISSSMPASTEFWINQTYPNWFYLNEIDFYEEDVDDAFFTPDFIAIPTQGNNPLSVTFAEASNWSDGESDTLEWVQWNFGDGTGANTTNTTVIHTYTSPGLYSVRMDAVSERRGYYYVSKLDYIISLNPTGITVNLDVKDASSGAYLQNVSVGIRNTTSGVWRNSTNGPWGCVAFQTTGAAYEYPISLNESITLAASAFGYNSVSETFAVPYDGYLKTLWLTRTGIVNATGTGTLSVSAIRNKDGTTISGISLALDTGEMAVTNTAGNVLFMNVSAGQRTITATDLSGNYQPATKDVVVTAGTTTMESIEMILEGETPRETYVAPTLAGDVLVDTDGDGIGDTPASVVGNYTSGQLNQKGSSGLMQMMGMFIQMWPLIFLVAFMKFMKDAFS